MQWHCRCIHIFVSCLGGGFLIWVRKNIINLCICTMSTSVSQFSGMLILSRLSLVLCSFYPIWRLQPCCIASSATSSTVSGWYILSSTMLSFECMMIAVISGQTVKPRYLNKQCGWLVWSMISDLYFTCLQHDTLQNWLMSAVHCFCGSKYKFQAVSRHPKNVWGCRWPAFHGRNHSLVLVNPCLAAFCQRVSSTF